MHEPQRSQHNHVSNLVFLLSSPLPIQNPNPNQRLSRKCRTQTPPNQPNPVPSPHSPRLRLQKPRNAEKSSSWQTSGALTTHHRRVTWAGKGSSRRHQTGTAKGDSVHERAHPKTATGEKSAEPLIVGLRGAGLTRPSGGGGGVPRLRFWRPTRAQFLNTGKPGAGRQTLDAEFTSARCKWATVSGPRPRSNPLPVATATITICRCGWPRVASARVRGRVNAGFRAG